jgi:hypothetical protein
MLGAVAPDTPVHGCLCFVDPEGFLAESGLPALRRLRIRGYPLYSPRRLALRLNWQGGLTPEQAQKINAHLAASLRPA